MAVIAAVEERLTDVRWAHGCTLVKWEGIGDSDTCEVYEFPGSPEACVQFSGDFGSGSIDLEGSIDGTNYISLKDIEGNTIQANGGDINTIRDNVRYVRPKTPAGSTGADINVYLLCKAVR